MKKIISFLLLIVLSLSLLSGCGGVSEKNGKLSVVTTIFPEYDWLMNVLGDKAQDVDVTMLLGLERESFTL